MALNTRKISIQLAIASALLISPHMAMADNHSKAVAEKLHPEMQQDKHHDTQMLLDMKNPRHAAGGVTTGGQPSESDFEHFKENGYSTIINLRGEAEFDGFNEVELVETLGMEYISIPIVSEADFNIENIIKLDHALKAADGKVLLHCGSGNRAGAILALKAFHVDGMSVDDAMALGLATGMTSLETAVRDLINSTE
jgi:uncharacterized protein (TIGR01244 family)